MIVPMLQTGAELIGSVPIAGPGEAVPAWLRLLGRLHPMVIHFPIALVVVAALVEWATQGWRAVRRVQGSSRHAISRPARTCITLALLSAILANATGWVLADNEPFGRGAAPTIELHRWFTIGASVAIAVCVLCAWMPGRWAARGYRALLLVSGLSLGIGTHFGGSLVHGPGHLLEPFGGTPSPAPTTTSPSDHERAVDPRENAERRAIEQIRATGGVVHPLSEETDQLAVFLHLHADRVTDASLTMLHGLEERIVVLDLTGTAISDTSADLLATFIALEELSLARTGCADRTVAALTTLPTLRSLNLYGSATTDAAIEHLATYPTLEVVYLDDSGVTSEGAAALEASSPGLNVVRDRE